MQGAILFWLFLTSFTWIVNGERILGEKAVATTPKKTAAAPGGSGGTFDVMRYGAKGDGRSDDTNAFMAAWKETCQSSGSATLSIPKGSFLVGPLKFKGPCKTGSLTVQMQVGDLKAITDLGKYDSDDWIEFGWVTGLTLTGGGTFDGQGAVSWPANKCPKSLTNCKVLPTSVKFVSMTKTVVKGIKSLNSKFFHIALLSCTDFQGSDITITAPGDSPNTDGIHIERSSGVSISNSVIGTGDDCISIGQANSNVHINGITCGPGHGISVGSLGKYPKEGDVRGLTVENCKLSGTMNGIRIKTWQNSPDASAASNMTFEHIEMKSVTNPIIIDQTYCPYAKCDEKAPSKVALSDVSFRHITGTSASPVAVTLECSQGVPCKNVNLEDIHLEPATGGAATTSSCQHVNAKYVGTQIPPACKSTL